MHACRLACLAAAAGALAAAELAPSADLGAMPEIAPRTWALLNIATDDQSVAAQVPRRRELALGASRIVDAGRGLGVHAEGVWAPLRAPRADPAVRVDALIAGIGASIERPGERFGWRLALTAGFRHLGDLGGEDLDRAESRLLRDTAYRGEGVVEHPDQTDPLVAARWASMWRLTDSDPLRQAPVDVVAGARVVRMLGLADGAEPETRLRLQLAVMLPSRTTASWFGLWWQDADSPSGGGGASRALATIDDDEEGLWFASGGALRLGARGDWVMQVGSALDLDSGAAVGSLGVVRTGDPPRATADGTSSLSFVMVRGERTAAGIATGDQLLVRGPAVLRSEIRTLIGDRAAPAAAVAADALRLDALLRVQLPLRIVPAVAIGPEAAVGLGVRRDAAEFAGRTFAAASRPEAVADLGLAGRVATGWQDGIASLEAAIGWAWWRALGGADALSSGGAAIPLDDAGDGMILRLGMLATF